MTTWSRKKHDDPSEQRRSKRDTSTDVDHATEEDLQPRDASEMPREPQNPVNPNGETAT